MKKVAEIPLAERQRWPKLSVSLTGPRAPGCCQSCGVQDLFANSDLRWWIECDEWERPTPVLVVLCRFCSDRIIQPHPRLYRAVRRPAPWPGAMEICLGCAHRDGVDCRHPSLKRNGGRGLDISVPHGDTVHLNFGGGRGEWMTLYPYEPRTCAGQTPRPTEEGATP